MDFSLNDAQRALRDRARAFANEVLAATVDEKDHRQEFPLAELRAAAEVGLTGLGLPERYGGTPADAVGTALVYEEIARVSASVCVILSVHNSLVAHIIDLYGDDEQKARYLPRLARGEILGSYALTEAGSGSDAGAMKTTARREGDEWVLDGHKRFITTAPYAGLFIVFAVTNPDVRPADGVSAFLVEPGFPGFSLGPESLKMGLLSSKIAEIRFDGCRVPAANLLGQEGRGFRMALQLLDTGRIGIGGQSLGIGQAALDAALSYSRQRQQFGKPIAEFQAIQFRLADMHMQLDAARLLVLRAATRKDAGEPFGREASMAKLFASEAAKFCADQAVQIHGGYGYIKEYPVERYYRDVKACEIYEGTSDIQRMVIARHLLRGGRGELA
ncbi:MAG: acyl-CoA dehydrogenase family protein [Chloroflexota bacterium]|nr:acyl-CoA dehydrogenase family protein [Chloroflexota bacterium]